MIRHAVRVLGSVVRAKVGSLRSPRWRAVERAHLKAQPLCAACGTDVRVQVHHIAPFREHPERELDPSNLISLCMSVGEHHLRLGHGDDWRMYNPQVVEDAMVYRRYPGMRKLVEAHARTNRTQQP